METWCEGVYFEPGPNKPNLAGIILSCGIHGDETGPIHLLQRLHNELQLAALAPSRPLLLIFGNPDAIRHQQRYVDSNLNRLFTRTPSPQPVAGESREAARARQLPRRLRAKSVLASSSSPPFNAQARASGSSTRWPCIEPVVAGF